MNAKLELIYTCRLLVPEHPSGLELKVQALGNLAAQYELKAARSEGYERDLALSTAKLYRERQEKLLIEKGAKQ